ncbi:MAG: transglutaminase family protein [Hyphomicrobiales bacterium]
MNRLVLFLLISLSCWSCTEEHFIKDAQYRSKVEKRFNERKEFASNRSKDLFNVFDQNLTNQEKEALQFLYAYMPLNDLADYNGNFFLKQVRSAFDAKNTFAYGQQIPDEVFRHFVLPYRVNNENLDSARWVFLEELKPRLKGMSMKDAALEVNHWCHEKVNYTPSDMRTSGPLSTVRTSWGRCGEESTFTVTAMRSVGIPARQVYTPRWAHCDDNHAWVEVWVDGKWSYLGACEPEPELNIGWFTEPARRAMLVHTKVFGDYQGTDEVVRKTKNFTEINVVNNYADVKKIHVRALDANGKPVKDAVVDFGLYNYAEFYPISRKHSDDNGLAFLTTGLGDLLISVSKDGQYANRKITVASTDTLELVLGDKHFGEMPAELNYVPPVEKKPFHVDESKKKENEIRLEQEDKMRHDYRATFIDSIASVTLAKECNVDPQLCWSFMKKSHGNWREIKKFIEDARAVKLEKHATELLNQISDKDLRDTRAAILMDHLSNSVNKHNVDDYKSKDIYNNYILNPRISNEWLIAYKAYLQKHFDGKLDGERGEKVTQLKKWIVDNIQMNKKDNYYNLPITPIGVNELKIANKQSRNIFFVAVCRSIGIPSRLEPTQKLPQYFDGNQWMTVFFEKSVDEQPITGLLKIRYDNAKFDPQYYTHFTIGKLNNGIFETLEYDWDKKLSTFPKTLDLEEGEYRLITGKRGADGTVYTYMNHFNISKNLPFELELKFRDPDIQEKVLGTLDLESKLMNKVNEEIKLKDLKKKDAILLMWLEPGKEPTRHVMEEFLPAKNKYNTWGGHIAVLQNDEITNESLSDTFFKNMPTDFAVYKDKGNTLFNMAKSELGIKGKIPKPLILILNEKGEMKFHSNGYKIGIHDHITKLLEKGMK